MSNRIAKIMILLVSVITIGTSRGSAAESDTASRKLAEQLLLEMKVDKNVKRSLKMVTEMQLSAMSKAMEQQKKLTPEYKKQILDMQKNVMEMLSKKMTWDQLKSGYIDIYVKYFNEQELQKLIDFYKSPVGKKLVKEQMNIMRESMQLGQKQAMSVLPEIQKMMQKQMKELKAKMKKESEEKSEE